MTERSGTLTPKFRGQGTVEFALVAMGFFLLMFGVLEGGRLLYTNHEVTHVAKEGARYAAAQGVFSGNVSSVGPIQTYLQSEVGGLDWNQVTLVADWPGDAYCDGSGAQPELNRPGCPVTVSVSYQYQPMFAMVFGAGAITLESESTMRVHY